MATVESLDLTTLIAAIKSDPLGAELFRADPVAYFKSNGIDTNGLSLDPARNPNGLRKTLVTDADLAMLAGGGCKVYGYYSCYSEGG